MKLASTIVLLGAATSMGCMGLYVEGSATMYPSMKYSEDSKPSNPADVVVGGDGSAFAIGVNVGVAFEGKRTSRFTMGYLAQSTSLPGGSSSGGIADFRYDGKIARLGSGKLLRLGGGLGVSSATHTKMDLAAGGESDNRGTTLQVYAGPSYAQYFGKRHELGITAVGAWSSFEAKNGSYSGGGVGLKLAYTFMFGDTRPDTTFIVPLDTTRNLMPAIERGAKAIGCTAEYGEKRDAVEGGGYGLVGAYVDAMCNGDNIFFLQRKAGMGILCNKMEEDDCRDLMGRIVDAAKKEPEKKPEPPPPAPPPAAPAPAPKEEPRPTDQSKPVDAPPPSGGTAPLPQ